VSLDDVIGADADGAPFTVADLADGQQAAREQAERIPLTNEWAQFERLQTVVATLGTLTPLERRVVRLRFIEGLELKNVCRRVHRSAATVSTASESGLRKIKRHFGIETEPERVKRFGTGHHRYHHVKKRQPHPDCSFCQPLDQLNPATAVPRGSQS
jgi:DNA-directed RNA polymerase sigma subunit (sigma70/sigma32)